MKRLIFLLSIVFLVASCQIFTQPPTPTPAIKPSGDPPAPFEAPLPSCLDQYMEWMKGYRADWYNWFKENPADIPAKFNVPCSGVTPSPAPTPVTPAPTPTPVEKPWWDYNKIESTHVEGLGSPSNPVPLTQAIPGMAGYGFHRYYGVEYTIPKGKIVSFKVDPFSNRPDFAGKEFRLYLINYDSYRTNVYQAVIYKADKSTGKEDLFRAIPAGSNFQATVSLDYAPGIWYRVELYENGLGDTPVSVWWNP